MTSTTPQEDQQGLGGSVDSSHKTNNDTDEDGDENSWVQATDWDDPLQTAVLYKSVDDEETSCGHALRWKPKVLVALKKCPICQESVSMICDGVVVANKSSNNDNTNPTMTCKFGKQVYRISVVEQSKDEKASNKSSSNSSSSSSTWSLFGSSSSPVTTTTITAQDRVRQALGLVEGYRILYKGKVIHSSSSKDATTNTTTSTTTVSKQLLELSAIEWKSPKGKKYMVVMGTQTGKELADNKSVDSPSSSSWSQRLLWLPFRMVQWGLGGAFWFAFSFFKPFIPQAYLPSSSERDDDHED
jgi:hypothetical protein